MFTQSWNKTPTVHHSAQLWLSSNLLQVVKTFNPLISCQSSHLKLLSLLSQHIRYDGQLWEIRSFKQTRTWTRTGHTCRHSTLCVKGNHTSLRDSFSTNRRTSQLICHCCSDWHQSSVVTTVCISQVVRAVLSALLRWELSFWDEFVL